MRRRLFFSKTVGISIALFVSALVALPACSKSGRDNSTDAAAQTTGTLVAMSGAHVAVYLRDVAGNTIDTSVVDAAAYSPKQTCGYCHDYSTIEDGYHFQQGADFLDDNYGTNHGSHAWVTSPGMIGKW